MTIRSRFETALESIRGCRGLRRHWRRRGLAASAILIAIGCVIAEGPVRVRDEDDGQPEPTHAGSPPGTGRGWKDHPDFPSWEFRFESLSHPVAQDLSWLLAHRRRTYQDPEAYGAALRELEEVRARIRAAAGMAAAILRDELARIDPMNAGAAMTAFTLMSEVGDQPEIVEALRAFVMTEEPLHEAASCGPRSCDGGEPPVRSARRAAMRTLRSAAESGSELAADALLQTARSLDPQVRRNAVRHYLAVRPGRMKAKAELRPVLRQAERHWLHRF